MNEIKRKFRWRLEKADINKIDDKILLLNLYITQGLLLLIGLLIIWLQSDQSIFHLLRIPQEILPPFIWGSGLTIFVIMLNTIANKVIPEELMNDGGINERIVTKRPLWHLIVMFLVVAFCEELLFRGAVQHIIGNYWTSLLFATVHLRYLRHWFMTALVFGTSYALGWVYEQTGSLWTAIIAHFLIDLIMGCIIKYRNLPEE